MMRLIWCWSQILINATKNEKIDIFFHSLLFLTWKYKIFSGTSGYRKRSNPIPSHNFKLVYALKKVWVNILSGAAVMERPDFLNEKKLVFEDIYGELIVKNIQGYSSWTSYKRKISR